MEDHQYEKILAWIEGAMTGEEKKAFETALKNDPALASEAALAKAALSAQSEKDVMEIRQHLREIMANPPAPGISKWLKIGVVLAAIALIWFGIFWFLNKNASVPPQQKLPATPTALLEKYFPAPATLIPENAVREFRSESDHAKLEASVIPLVENLNLAFSKNDAKKVSQIFGQFKVTDPGNQVISRSDLARFEGIFLLRQGRAREALPLFDEAEKLRPDEMAQWYRAGALIATGDIEGAVLQLKKIIAQPGHPKRESAKNLLDEMIKR